VETPPVRIFDTIGDAKQAIADYPSATIPDEIRDQFEEYRAAPAPVARVVHLGELLYANRSLIDDDAKAFAAGLIAHAAKYSYFSMNVDDRGNRIVAALCRDLSEEPPLGTEFPAPETDPEPKARYLSVPPVIEMTV
jgi:hypothetical protein